MGQSTSVETTKNTEDEEEQTQDKRARSKKFDLKNINDHAQDDVTQSPTDSFFPIMNTAEAPSDETVAMSSSVVETTSSLKENSFKSNRNANNSVGIASKIIPKRPWSSYHLFQLANTTTNNSISDSKARMIRSPRIRPRETKGTDTKSKARIKFAEPPKPIFNNNRHQLEKLAKQNAEIDEIITMLHHHKISEDEPIINQTNDYVPSSEFQFSFPTANNNGTYIPRQQYLVPPPPPVIINDEEDEDEDEDELQHDNNNNNNNNQFKYDVIKNRKILPLPKRKLRRNLDSTSGISSNGSSALSSPIPSLPSSPFTFSSDKPMPKVSFLTDASRNLLQQQQQQQQQQQYQGQVQQTQQQSQQQQQDSSNVGSAVDSTHNRKDRPNMSKKIKSMERVHTTLLNDEVTMIGKRKEITSNNPVFKSPPKMEVFTKYNPPKVFDFANFNFQFNPDLNNNNNSSSNSSNETKKMIQNTHKPTTTPFIAPDQPMSTATSNDPSTNTTTSTTIPTFGQHATSGKPIKGLETKKILNAKAPSAAIKRPSISQPTNTTTNNSTSTTTAKAKIKQEGESKKKTATSNSKSNKKNKKSKSKKPEEASPGGFLSSDITLFENPLSDDWICFFCQFDIFCRGFEDAKKKNGYYRRKKERLRRANEARRIAAGGGGVESSEEQLEEEHRHYHHHHHHHA